MPNYFLLERPGLAGRSLAWARMASDPMFRLLVKRQAATTGVDVDQVLAELFEEV